MDKLKEFLMALLGGIFKRVKEDPIPTVAAAVTIFIQALEQLKKVADHHEAAASAKIQEANKLLEEAHACTSEACAAKNLMQQVAQFTPPIKGDEGVSAA